MEVIAMGRGSWVMFRTVVASLLMLATLLVYTAPSHASLVSHVRSMAPHEHAVTATANEPIAVLEHDQVPCTDADRLDDGVCCSVAQCATMHAGLPAGAVETLIPGFVLSSDLPAPAMSEGVGSPPALRPPRRII
jgi:hypothetical protein